MEIELRIPEHLQNNPFLERFIQNVKEGKLETPSFPDVALKISKAIEQDCEIEDLVKIISMDPVISAKLIQVVNSPFYMLMNPISNCFNAINRLGRKTTRYLVTTFSLQNLIKSNKPKVKKLIQQSWQQSVKVSSICFIHAKLIGKFDPNEALLAGLLHNIGALPILSFINNLPEDSYNLDDVELCIDGLSGQLGAIILEDWEFPENLKCVPEQSSDWFSVTGPDLTLSDIVLLAKYHYFMGMPGRSDLPLIDKLPAYEKLGNAPLTPEMSLQILADAKQQISDTMKFFSM